MTASGLVIFALWASSTMVAFASETAKSPGAACARFMSKEFEVRGESISEGDDDYVEYAGFRFGLSGGKNVFVRYMNDDPIEVESVPFTDLDGSKIRLTSRDLAVNQGDLYVRSDGRQKIYCLVVPFDGLGLSGRYQKLAALIALTVRDGVASKPVGDVIRRR